MNGFITYIPSRDDVSAVVVEQSKSDTTSAKNDENSKEIALKVMTPQVAEEKKFSVSFRSRIRFAAKQSKC